MAFPPLNEQLDVIRRGTDEVLPEDELERKIASSIRTGAPLRVKQGFDPTRPDLHIGHVVGLRKLRDFQDLGHQVVFLIGDFTALIGDPSGMSEMRPALSPEEVTANAATYREQVFKLLDPAKTVIARNSEWCADLDLGKVIRLTSLLTVARMLEREDFAKRYAEGRPIALHEFLYPLLQGYDSVALKADVELGGTDQKFNLLMARDVQRDFGMDPQIAVTVPLLEGTDGTLKMSKTSQNAIGLTDPPGEVYGRTMSIPDALIARWFELVLGMPEADLQEIRKSSADGGANPRDQKRRLARDLVTMLHGEEAAAAAAAEFDRIFVKHELPEDVPVRVLDPSTLSSFDPESGTLLLAQALHAAELVPSYSEGVRMLQQGAVTLNGERADASQPRIDSARAWTVKVGKRRFAEIRFQRR